MHCYSRNKGWSGCQLVRMTRSNPRLWLSRVLTHSTLHFLPLRHLWYVPYLSLSERCIFNEDGGRRERERKRERERGGRLVPSWLACFSIPRTTSRSDRRTAGEDNARERELTPGTQRTEERMTPGTDVPAGAFYVFSLRPNYPHNRRVGPECLYVCWYPRPMYVTKSLGVVNLRITIDETEYEANIEVSRASLSIVRMNLVEYYVRESRQPWAGVCLGSIVFFQKVWKEKSWIFYIKLRKWFRYSLSKFNRKNWISLL